MPWPDSRIDCPDPQDKVHAPITTTTNTHTTHTWCAAAALAEASMKNTCGRAEDEAESSMLDPACSPRAST